MKIGHSPSIRSRSIGITEKKKVKRMGVDAPFNYYNHNDRANEGEGGGTLSLSGLQRH